jgi:hypothetical protein
VRRTHRVEVGQVGFICGEKAGPWPGVHQGHQDKVLTNVMRLITAIPTI